jgi:hypothetical protein
MKDNGKNEYLMEEQNKEGSFFVTTQFKPKNEVKFHILSEDVQSDDGVANACIAEAANRIEELEAKVSELNQKLCRDIFRLRGS